MTGSRPLRPQHLLQDDLWSLVTKCLVTSPSQRPTGEQVTRALTGQRMEGWPIRGFTAGFAGFRRSVTYLRDPSSMLTLFSDV